MRELAERDTADVMAALKAWVAGLDSSSDDYQHLLLEALWLHQTHNVVDEALLKRLLDSPEFRARAAAVRVLCEWRERVPHSLELVHQRVNDSYARVRLEAVRALSFFESPQAIEAALDVLNDDMDHWLDYTLDETLRAVEASLGHSLPAMAEHEHAEHGHADHHAAHEHAAGHQHGAAVGPKPIVFLDKSPRIVAYQLNRLPTPQLLAIDRTADDAKFATVYGAILVRSGVSRQDREAAVAALARLNSSTPIVELLAGIDASRLPDAAGPDLRHPTPRPAKGEPVRGAGKKTAQQLAAEREQVARQLAGMLLGQPADLLQRHADDLRKGAGSEHAAVRAIAVAGLISAGEADGAWQAAKASPQAKLDFLAALPLVADKAARAELRDEVVTCLAEKQTSAVRRAAVTALAAIPAKQAENFHLAAELIDKPALRAAAVGALLKIAPQYRPVDDARRVAGRSSRMPNRLRPPNARPTSFSTPCSWPTSCWPCCRWMKRAESDSGCGHQPSA